MERWSGKVAVVTGASSGIGACIVKRLVKAGLIVVGLARRAELVEELAKELSSCKGKLYAKKVDLTNKEEIITAFNWIAANVGPVQILINNAGVSETTTLIDGEFEVWKRTIDTNLLAAAITAKEAMKMIKEKSLDGHIVNINSISGNRILPTTNIYGPTKFALSAYTELLRHEITAAKLSVKVTSVYPGLVETPLIHNSPEKELARKNWPRIEADAVADAVLYVIGTPQEVQITQLTIQPLGEAM